MKRLANFTAMLSIRFALRSLLHKFTAKNRHGLHSPFVYRLVDEVIYDFSDKKEYRQIEKARKRLLHDRSNASSGILKQPKLVRLIYRLIVDRQPQIIVEIGEGREISELYAHVLPADTKFYTPESYPSGISLDLIWISDTNTLRYFELCLPKVADGTMIIVNDIHCDAKRKEAWVAIKANQQVTATIDLFWIGLVYFRKGQVKEDFKIRF